MLCRLRVKYDDPEMPSAISNAVFDATGVRLRSIPYTPAKMKAALGST
jgi:nicotinate dehydrogenase subunit B